MLNICAKAAKKIQKCKCFVLFPLLPQRSVAEKETKGPENFRSFSSLLVCELQRILRHTAGKYYLHCRETFLSGHISYLSTTQSTFSNNQLNIVM